MLLNGGDKKSMFNDIYKDKVILVTGHTGFKGSWLSIWLTMLGAKVVGLALDPNSEKCNYSVTNLKKHLYADIRGDIRNIDDINSVIQKYQPEIIFHLAAQALVRTAYEKPKDTFETNLIGSLNILECVRHNNCVHTVVMITSDKCYENVEQIWGYKETDRMGGYDPYSASKGCAELMISSYRNSYFNPLKYTDHKKAICSVRAGNVIGGGDWSENRLIPDCIRSIESDQTIEIRSPNATRPWEHVLEPLCGYLRVGQMLMENPEEYSNNFNFGPPLSSNKTVWDVVTKLVDYYGNGSIADVSDQEKVHENTLLNLDITKAYVMLGWEAKLTFEESIEYTVDWYKEALIREDMFEFCKGQILKHYSKHYLWEDNV